MSPDPASTPRDRLAGPYAGRTSPSDGLDAARGFLLGAVLGLVCWLAVIGLAWAVWCLA